MVIISGTFGRWLDHEDGVIMNGINAFIKALGLCMCVYVCVNTYSLMPTRSLLLKCFINWIFFFFILITQKIIILGPIFKDSDSTDLDQYLVICIISMYSVTFCYNHLHQDLPFWSIRNIWSIDLLVFQEHYSLHDGPPSHLTTSAPIFCSFRYDIKDVFCTYGSHWSQSH